MAGRLWILAVVLSLAACEGAGQIVGDPAPNKAFIQNWNLAAGYDHLSDLALVPAGGRQTGLAVPKVTIIEWWKST